MEQKRREEKGIRRQGEGWNVRKKKERKKTREDKTGVDEEREEKVEH